MKPSSLFRCLIFVAVILVISAPVPVLHAQGGKLSKAYVLTVVADRTNGIYKQGETVTFTIKLLHDNEPVNDAEVQWNTSKDGVPPSHLCTVQLKAGTATVTGKLDEPGFLQLNAAFQTPDKKIAAIAGAAIDPLQIKPSLPVPDDFDPFWSAQKKKLAAVPINPRLTSVKSPAASIVCFDLQADCVGAPVSGYFARPVGAKPKSLPIILLTHVVGVSGSDLTNAVSWAKENFLALDINAHGLPNGKPDKFYADLAAGDLKDYPRFGRESREKSYWLGMLLRLVRANDFLASQPEWDGRTVITHGRSQGGAQAFVAAGLDPRVTFFAANVTGLCDLTGSVAGRVGGWPKILYPLGPDGKPHPSVIETARYFDAMNFATRTKAAGIIGVGFIDTVCPPTSIYAAYNNLPGKKEIFNDPVGGHGISRQGFEALRRAIFAHVEEMK